MSLASPNRSYFLATHSRVPHASLSQLFTTCLFKLKLWASKSTTDVQDVHVEAQIRLNPPQKTNKNKTSTHRLIKSWKGTTVSENILKTFSLLSRRGIFRDSTHPHVKHTAGVWQCMGVSLWQVLARAGDVEGYPDHLNSQLHGCLQQVPAALQGRAEGHAGFSCVGLSGQLQQQPTKDFTKAISLRGKIIKREIESLFYRKEWGLKVANK